MRSEDGARSWQLISAIGVNNTKSIAVHPLNSDYMLHIDADNVVSTSSDGGQTWTSTSSRTAPLREVLVADVSEAGAFFLLGPEFLQGSQRSYPVLRLNIQEGNDVVRLQGPSSPTFGAISFAATHTNPPVIFAVNATNEYLYRADNGRFSIVSTNWRLHRVWVAPSDPNVLYGRLFTVTGSAPFLRSDDGGLSWRELPNAPDSSNANFVRIDPEVPSIVHIIDEVEGVLKSVDGGVNWTPIDRILPNRNAAALTHDPAGRVWIGSEELPNSYFAGISSDAKTLLFSTLLGGSGGAIVNAMAADPYGRILLTGETPSADFPMNTVFGANNPLSPGFICILTPAGELESAYRLDAAPSAIHLDSTGLIHLAGATSFPGLRKTTTTQQPLFGGIIDGFWTTLNAAGDAVIHNTYLGGELREYITGLVALSDGTVALTGQAQSANFPITPDAELGPSQQTYPFITLASIGSPPVTTARILDVPSSGTVALATPGASEPVTSGYATASVRTGPVPHGIAAFSVKQNGVTVSEAAVPATAPGMRFRIVIESREFTVGNGPVQVNTGVAIANTRNVPTALTFTLRDGSGQVVATGSGILPERRHVARFIHELSTIADGFVPPADFQGALQFGSLEIASTEPIYAVGLRLTVNQRGETLLSTIPVVTFDEVSVVSSWLPQVVNGAGYATSIILMNVENRPKTGAIRFRDDSGQPVEVTLLDGRTNSSFDYSVPAGGVAVFETMESGTEIQTGSVEVDGVTVSAPIAAGIIRFVQNGVLVTEAGSAGVREVNRGALYIDASRGHNTGLAIVNTREEPVTVTFSARKADGSLVDAAPLVKLPPHGHLSRFVNELVPSWPTNATGLLQIDVSGSSIAPLTLRTLLNERGEFLLTTFPFIRGDMPYLPPYPFLVFPQFVDGGGYQTELVFIHWSSGLPTPATLAIEFVDSSGQPVPPLAQ
jgi:hypothetical protein